MATLVSFAPRESPPETLKISKPGSGGGTLIAHSACIMKIHLCAAAICVLTTSGFAQAQLADSVVATTAEHYPAAKSGDLPGKIAINVLRASAGIPIEVGKTTTLIAGAGYELIDAEPTYANSLQLHSVKGVFGIDQRIDKRFELVLLGEAGLASDFRDPVGSRDLLLSATAFATYSFTDSFKLGAGAIYDRRTGELKPLPALLLKLKVGERFRVRGFAPVWLTAEYHLFDWLDVGARANLDGNRFHLGKETWQLDNAELAYSNFTVGPKLTFNFTDWLHLDVYAAGAVYRRFEVFQNDESYLRSDLSPTIGYGARFWIAPSGW